MASERENGEERPEAEDHPSAGASAGDLRQRNRSLRRGLAVRRREPRLRRLCLPLGHSIHHKVRILPIPFYLIR